jgi:hypothetical protein
MNMLRIGIGLASVVALGSVGCGGGSASGGGGTTAEGRAPTVSAPASATQFVAAIDAALAAHPGARIIEVEIDDSYDVGALEVEYFPAEGGGARELFLDPGSMQVMEDRAESPSPEEAEVHAVVRARLEAGQGDLRARLEEGAFARHSMEALQEVELTLLEGHYVIACEVLQDGARATHFHAIDGSYLGADASEALAQLAQHPELEVR